MLPTPTASPFDEAFRSGREAERFKNAQDDATRTPDLADWVAAAVRSKLPAPYGWQMLADIDHDWRLGLINIEVVLSGESAVIKECRPDEGEIRNTRCATPAELRAALDAIADKAQP